MGRPSDTHVTVLSIRQSGRTVALIDVADGDNPPSKSRPRKRSGSQALSPAPPAPQSRAPYAGSERRRLSNRPAGRRLQGQRLADDARPRPPSGLRNRHPASRDARSRRSQSAPLPVVSQQAHGHPSRRGRYDSVLCSRSRRGVPQRSGRSRPAKRSSAMAPYVADGKLDWAYTGLGNSSDFSAASLAVRCSGYITGYPHEQDITGASDGPRSEATPRAWDGAL
jgi:hypothetical protein